MLRRIGHHFQLYGWLWFVISIGTVLRGWALWQTAIINPDGILYIYQAKAILTGNWSQLTTCGLPYISIYPFLIVAVHTVIDSWIMAPQIVSMLFSIATLIPIYLTCRSLFDSRIAAMATLIAAMNPVMCSRSGDVVRGPISWFFLALGIYYVVRFWDVRSRHYYLFFSTIAFILAAWARIEAILMIGVSGVFITFLGTNGLLKRVFAFALPLIVIGAGVLISMTVLDIPMDRLLRFNQVATETTTFIDTYHQVSTEIKKIMTEDLAITMRFFLSEVKNHIWLIAIGTMINRTLEAFFYPFVPFFLIGFWRSHHHARSNSKWRYFLLAFVSGYLLLYFRLLNVWVMEYRYLMLVFIPGIPLAAAGLSWVVEWVESRWHFDKKWVVFALTLLLLASGLPKNMQPRDPDKIVFVEIAKRIAEIQGAEKPALISSSASTHRLISLYANIDHLNPPCPLTDQTGLVIQFADDAEKMATHLKSRNIGFFIYEERHWHKNNIEPEGFFLNEYFQLIDQWHHRDTGTMRLYQIK